MSEALIKKTCEDLVSAQAKYQKRLDEVEAHGKTLKEILEKEQKQNGLLREELKKREAELDTLSGNLKTLCRKYEAEKSFGTIDGFAKMIDPKEFKNQNLRLVAKAIIDDPHGPEYKKSFEEFLRDPRSDRKPSIKLNEVIDKVKNSSTPEKESFIKKSLNSGSQSGSYLCPPEYDFNIIKQIRETSPLEEVCMTKVISRPAYVFTIQNKLPIATHDESELNDPKKTKAQNYSMGELALKKCYAEPGLPNDLISDSVVDIESELLTDLAYSFQLLQNKMFIRGDGGAKQPPGLLSYAKNGKLNPSYDEPLKIRVFEKSAADLTSDDGRGFADTLLDMEAQLASGYKKNAVWLIHRLVKNQYRKVKTSTGQYLMSYLQGWGGWQGVPKIKDGRDGKINGYGMLECDDLDSTLTADKYPIFFGDWRNFMVIRKMGMTMIIDPLTVKGFTIYFTERRYTCGIKQGRGIIVLKVT